LESPCFILLSRSRVELALSPYQDLYLETDLTAPVLRDIGLMAPGERSKSSGYAAGQRLTAVFAQMLQVAVESSTQVESATVNVRCVSTSAPAQAVSKALGLHVKNIIAWHLARVAWG